MNTKTYPRADAIADSEAAEANAPGNTAESDGDILHASIYQELRRRLFTGKITPGLGLSTRVLASELGVSQMPVRDALSRLAADGAIEIRSKRRIQVPAMTRARFDDLLQCRLLLEPQAARMALPFIDAARVEMLKKIDAQLDAALRTGDVAVYMENNFAFHFTMYRATGRRTMNQLIETLWLQFGPFMRVVYGRFGTANLVDQHALAIQAIENGDADALEKAIASDIADGMGLIGRNGLEPA